jgi:predicted transcriptional regulator
MVVLLGRYRRRFEIIGDILSVAEKNSVKKTRIMYVANLSHGLLEKYLAEAISLGLLKFNNDGYEITEKGKFFLEKYRDFSVKHSKVLKQFESLSLERELLERMLEKPGAGKDRRGKA